MSNKTWAVVMIVGIILFIIGLFIPAKSLCLAWGLGICPYGSPLNWGLMIIGVLIFGIAILGGVLRLFGRMLDD